MAKKKEAAQDAAVKVVWVEITEVKPNPENPRKISEAKIKELMQSMQDLPEMFEYRFLVVDRYTGYLLGGNQRWTAAKRLGLKTVPVAYSDEMTEQQKKQFIIRDNIEAGEWNEEALHTDFKDFPLVSWGVLPEPAKRAEDVSPVANDKIIYDNALVKQIVVFYSVETHAQVTEKIAQIKADNFLGDTRDVLLFLTENYI